ncbi:MAG TPA: hypothetical protein VLC47_00670 [Burkholderiales bacterium]|nr:hypothetical protein [Burkholderiales bacterium]
MADVIAFPVGGYRYVKGVFQYSGGVAAERGFEIERVRFRRPLPLADGFRVVEAQVRGMGRPLTAFCACELRSPAPFTEEGFTEFNRVYVGTLERWGLYRAGLNPVARSNVCPEIGPPAVPSLHAFSYTVGAEHDTPASFVVAGSGEAPEGRGNYRDHIVRRGDTSPAGLREKARWVLAEMERRMAALGCGWRDATATQLYTVHDVHPFLAEEIVRRGAAPGGLTWHFCRPPVVELDYEMDVRGVDRELVL